MIPIPVSFFLSALGIMSPYLAKLRYDRATPFSSGAVSYPRGSLHIAWSCFGSGKRPVCSLLPLPMYGKELGTGQFRDRKFREFRRHTAEIPALDIMSTYFPRPPPGFRLTGRLL